MSKELYIEATEQIIEELMEKDPSLSWDEAYDISADLAYDRMTDNLADAIDHYRLLKKEGRL